MTGRSTPLDERPRCSSAWTTRSSCAGSVRSSTARIHICCWNTSTVANLKDVLDAEAALPVAEALDLAFDLLEAAEHLAGHDVVHLDIKPSNVVMTDPPRLIDLGAARSFVELEARRTPIGTAAYMAPEQCDPGSTPVGPPADVWGVGTTLYHALTGQRPFSRAGPRGSEPTVRYRQLVEEPRPIPDYVPEPVAQEVMRMLARDPAARPTAAEAAHALDALADAYAER